MKWTDKQRRAKQGKDDSPREDRKRDRNRSKDRVREERAFALLRKAA